MIHSGNEGWIVRTVAVQEQYLISGRFAKTLNICASETGTLLMDVLSAKVLAYTFCIICSNSSIDNYDLIILTQRIKDLFKSRDYNLKIIFFFICQ